MNSKMLPFHAFSPQAMSLSPQQDSGSEPGTMHGELGNQAEVHQPVAWT